MKQYKRLTTTERENIFLLLNQHISVREIGRRLGRNHGTISREIENHSGFHKQYSPAKADFQSKQNRGLPRRKKLDDPALKGYVVSKLAERWSPEQIGGRLGRVAPNLKLSYETIYRFVYSSEGRKNRYFEFLRKGHKRRSPWYGRKSGKTKKVFIPNRVWIEARPEAAIKRLTVGHLEGDLMEGNRKTGQAVSVVADRKSGLVLLDKLTSKVSKDRMAPLLKRFDRYPKAMHQTITFDNGTENAEHEVLQKFAHCQTYFCHPYHPYEKGTVENTVGLVRDYIPKGSDLTQVSPNYLAIISQSLNDRPRKRHGFKTPNEILFEETGWCVIN